MVFMHGYMKYTQPLFIQAIMALKGIYDSKVSLHWLHQPNPLLTSPSGETRSSRSTSSASPLLTTSSVPSSLPLDSWPLHPPPTPSPSKPRRTSKRIAEFRGVGVPLKGRGDALYTVPHSSNTTLAP